MRITLGVSETALITGSVHFSAANAIALQLFVVSPSHVAVAIAESSGRRLSLAVWQVSFEISLSEENATAAMDAFDAAAATAAFESKFAEVGIQVSITHFGKLQMELAGTSLNHDSP